MFGKRRCQCKCSTLCSPLRLPAEIARACLSAENYGKKTGLTMDDTPRLQRIKGFNSTLENRNGLDKQKPAHCQNEQSYPVPEEQLEDYRRTTIRFQDGTTNTFEDKCQPMEMPHKAQQQTWKGEAAFRSKKGTKLPDNSLRQRHSQREHHRRSHHK